MRGTRNLRVKVEAKLAMSSQSVGPPSVAALNRRNSLFNTGGNGGGP